MPKFFSPRVSQCVFCSSDQSEFAEDSDEVSMDLVGVQQGQVVNTGCRRCRELIHTDRRDGLAGHSAQAVADHQPDMHHALTSGTITWTDLNANVATMHRASWDNGTGDYTLITPRRRSA
jgi:hypothetical protein